MLPGGIGRCFNEEEYAIISTFLDTLCNAESPDDDLDNWGGALVPPPLTVSHTFIDYPIKRSHSLEEFLQLRQVHSWPSTPRQQICCRQRRARQAAPMAAFAGDGDNKLGQPPRPLKKDDVGIANSHDVKLLKETTPVKDSGSKDGHVPKGPIACEIARWRLGSDELPTVGSAGHYAFRCKPCAFLSKGCNNGLHCPWCHLCEPGEKGRRRKQRQKLASRAAARARWLANVPLLGK